MKSALLCTAVLLASAAAPADSATLISVVDPTTGRLVGHATITVTVPGQPAVPPQRATTGLCGEPVDLDQDLNLDPRWKEVVVQASKAGITTTMRLTHDPNAYFWKQDFDEENLCFRTCAQRGAWRPQKVCDYQSDNRALSSLDYGTYRSYLELAEKSRQEFERQRYRGAIHTFLDSAADPERARLIFLSGLESAAVRKREPAEGVISKAEQEELKKAFDDLIACNLKPPCQMQATADLAAALRKVVRAHLKEMDPRLEAILVRPTEPGFLTRVHRVWVSPLDARTAAVLRQHMAVLIDSGLEACNDQYALDGLERALRELVDHVKAGMQVSRSAAMDEQWRSRLQRGLKAQLSEALKKDIQEVLTAPADPARLRHIEVVMKMRMGLAGMDSGSLLARHDALLRAACIAGLRDAKAPAALRQRIDESLEAISVPLERAYFAGLLPPVDHPDLKQGWTPFLEESKRPLLLPFEDPERSVQAISGRTDTQEALPREESKRPSRRSSALLDASAPLEPQLRPDLENLKSDLKYVEAALAASQSDALIARLQPVVDNRVHPLIALLVAPPKTLELNLWKGLKQTKHLGGPSDAGCLLNLKELIHKCRTEAPDPPEILLAIPKPFVIPVRSYRAQ